jgi:hypothetical protein
VSGGSRGPLGPVLVIIPTNHEAAGIRPPTARLRRVTGRGPARYHAPGPGTLEV